MKKLPIGIQTFSKLIEDNCVYVDKTEQIYQLIKGDCYFLSRPRRFGKSLLCTTFKALFEGRKELFKNLWIEKHGDYDWKKYPVIHIDFNLIGHETPEELKKELVRTLGKIFLTENIDVPTELNPGAMLQELTYALFKKYNQKVVILIDEYDKAILRHVDNISLATTMRETLKSFYEPIKGFDAMLRFVFITGVSKFSKTSIFSGLNNLKDLTLDARATILLGYTEDEIKLFFAQHFDYATKTLQISLEELSDQMRTWYNGYFFESQKTPTLDKKVYNPFSILNFFDSLKFSNYWFETGTPTFLIKLIKANGYKIEKFEALEMTASDLGSFEVETLPLNTILFQTGYLTIKDYNPDTTNYLLTYPNKETSDSLLKQIFNSLTQTPTAYLNNVIAKIRTLFQKNNLIELKELLTQFFATIPHDIHIDHEHYYQTAFYILFKLLGTQILVEQATNVGRIDALVQTPTICFIIEFKVRGPAENALKQIHEKKYYQAYLPDGKTIVLVGIKFDLNLKNVSHVEWQELP